MQPASRNWLILLAIVSAGAIAHISVPTRRLLPTTRILASFPTRIGTYSAQPEQPGDFEATRQEYAPAEVVYRDYANADGVPINLFIAPEPVGGDTLANCAVYEGSVITELSLQPVVGVPGLMLNEIVLRSGGKEDQMSVCAYYWRTPKGPADDTGINLLKGRLVGLRGRTSFRIDMCTQVRDISETSAAFGRLSGFASVVDPEVRRLLQEAIDGGK